MYTYIRKKNKRYLQKKNWVRVRGKENKKGRNKLSGSTRMRVEDEGTPD